MVNPFFANSLYAFTTFGFSLLQGPHQLAQKSTSTYLPCNEDSANVFPLGVCCKISGAFLPTATLAYVSIIFFISMPLGEFFMGDESSLYSGSTSVASA